MPLTMTPAKVATSLAAELALQSARATAAGLNLTAYLIDMAAGEVSREAVKMALIHGPDQIMLPASALVSSPT